MSDLDSVSVRVLRTFSELGRETLDLHALVEVAGGNPPAAREAVLDVLESLKGKGLIEASEGGDFFTRTEEGRLAAAGPRDATLYTRANCRLCEQAKAALLPILREFGGSLREVDVDADPELHDLFTDDVPVIFLGGSEVARHRVDAAAFRRRLEHAAMS